DALMFAIRRLGDEPVVLLLATDERFAAPSLPELRVQPLGGEAAGRWLDDRLGDRLSPLTRDRLLRRANGNPLALAELPNALSAEQLAGRTRLPDPLPVAAHVTASLASRLDGLGNGALRVLLVAAAADTDRTAVVHAAAERLDAGARELGELEIS